MHNELTKDMLNSIVAGAMAHTGDQDGYHGLKIPAHVHSSLLSYEGYRALDDCLAKVGGVSALSVQVSGGVIRLALPGLWAIQNKPQILLGFNTDGPITVDLGEYVSGLMLMHSSKNIYSATFDGVTLPISIRVHFEGEISNYPRMISASSTPPTLRELPSLESSSGSGAKGDWNKLRDLVTDGPRVFEVVGYQTQPITTKEGKTFEVNLIHTEDQGKRVTLSVTPSQYRKIVGLCMYKKMSMVGATEDTPVNIMVSEDKPYNGYKTFRFYLAN